MKKTFITLAIVALTGCVESSPAAVCVDTKYDTTKTLTKDGDFVKIVSVNASKTMSTTKHFEIKRQTPSEIQFQIGIMRYYWNTADQTLYTAATNGSNYYNHYTCK